MRVGKGGDRVGRAEPQGGFLFELDGIDRDDLCGAIDARPLDRGGADAAGADDDDRIAAATLARFAAEP